VRTHDGRLARSARARPPLPSRHDDLAARPERVMTPPSSWSPTLRACIGACGPSCCGPEMGGDDSPRPPRCRVLVAPVGRRVAHPARRRHHARLVCGSSLPPPSPARSLAPSPPGSPGAPSARPPPTITPSRPTRPRPSPSPSPAASSAQQTASQLARWRRAGTLRECARAWRGSVPPGGTGRLTRGCVGGEGALGATAY